MTRAEARHLGFSSPINPADAGATPGSGVRKPDDLWRGIHAQRAFPKPWGSPVVY